MATTNGHFCVQMAAVGELVVLAEGAPSGSMPVHSGDVLTLGRAPDCHVRIRLASVSRVSARLAAEGAHAFFVNASAGAPAVLTRGAAAQRVDVPLGLPVCLHHGDRLAFGPRDFVFNYGAWGLLILACGLGAWPFPGGPFTHFSLPLFCCHCAHTSHLHCQCLSCRTPTAAARA